MNTKSEKSLFQSDIPHPQYVYDNMNFKCKVLDPPDYKGGSWTGAGKIIINKENNEFILTARPRKAGEGIRGYAANIYNSKDGEKFKLLTSLSKEEVSNTSKMMIHSIEGTQLLKDPLTGKWHFYISVDTGQEFVWGGTFWETLLLTSDDLKGPWESRGLVIKHGQSYDSVQSRDSTIDIVNGDWLCIYRAHDDKRNIRSAFAMSLDGINWKKYGTVTLDGNDIRQFGLSGTIFEGTSGPIFMGLRQRPERAGVDKAVEGSYIPGGVPHGRIKFDFSAYHIDSRNVNLETIFSAPWKGGSKYEHPEFPVFYYSSLIHDPFKNRVLMYIEAIIPDSKIKERNGTVEPVLLYECQL